MSATVLPVLRCRQIVYLFLIAIILVSILTFLYRFFPSKHSAWSFALGLKVREKKTDNFRKNERVAPFFLLFLSEVSVLSLLFFFSSSRIPHVFLPLLTTAVFGPKRKIPPSDFEATE